MFKIYSLIVKDQVQQIFISNYPTSYTSFTDLNLFLAMFA